MKSQTDQAWDDLCSASSAPPPVVGQQHPFLKLGPAPFVFTGMSKGASNCALCGTRIKNLYAIEDGAKVGYILGSECILKLGNGFSAHLVGQVKTAKKRYEREQRYAREMRRQQVALADNSVNSQAERPAEYAWLKAYTGNFGFYLSLQMQLNRNGFLSEKQWGCVTRAIAQASAPRPARTYSLAVGEVLIVTKFFAKIIGRDTGLNRPHFAIEVVEVKGESEKAWHVTGRLSAHRTAHCCVCGLPLTNSVSVAAGIGPICGSRYEVSTAEELQAKLQTEYKTAVTFWLPKSQVKERQNISKE